MSRPVAPYELVQTRNEAANALTAQGGMLLAIVAAAYLVVVVAIGGTVRHVLACSIYSTTLVFLYVASSLYHSARSLRWRRRFWFLDHTGIYLLIAGTYTPFALVWLEGPLGSTFCAAIWSLAVIGVGCKLFARRRYPVLSVSMYVVLGWSCLGIIRPLIEAAPTHGITWVTLGGLSYTVGVLFFAFDRLPYFHAIWHLFVIAGSACHFWAILRYVTTF